LQIADCRFQIEASPTFSKSEIVNLKSEIELITPEAQGTWRCHVRFLITARSAALALGSLCLCGEN